ncbi:DUF523 domain-containing protein [Clostridium algoriphilum]|uniref:DUF523 domain-containing protein n=1 Tax=Clostridium algoriphilum TaxID=198347 RepID=UPI001CF53481|nr:DUF523 domain-containing protein [Clostridium algoriphilum]MCB2294141.1 DUF523 domain-containing protein [Clostridium algoriphilum]
MIIVSACLCGINCKYDGGNNINAALLKLLKEGKVMPVCPEQLGGLETPRVAREIINGNGLDVLEGNARIVGLDKNEDVTQKFIKGAYETLYIAEAVGANIAILKARSPSCGVSKIYDGTFSKTLRQGNGITAQLLILNGIKVFTEGNIDKVEL